MKKRKHSDLDKTLRILSQKRDININGRTIQLLSDKIWQKGESIENPAKRHDCGNKTWGAIDYLTKHASYRLVRVSTHTR